MNREQVVSAIVAKREEMLNSGAVEYSDKVNLAWILNQINQIEKDISMQFYRDRPPYATTMYAIKLIAALCIQAGELYGMKEKDNIINVFAPVKEDDI